MTIGYWWKTLKLDTPLSDLHCYEHVLLFFGVICLLAIFIILPRDFIREIRKNRRTVIKEKIVEIPQAPEEMR